MKYKFVWPLAFTLLLMGCNKKDATTETATSPTAETAVAPEETNNATGDLSEEAKKAAQNYVGKGSPTVLFFFAEWCPAGRDFLDNLTMFFPDLEEEKKAFKIGSIPSLFFFDKNGKFIESTTGGLSSEKLQEQFNKITDGKPVETTTIEKPQEQPKEEAKVVTTEKPKAEPVKKP